MSCKGICEKLALHNNPILIKSGQVVIYRQRLQKNLIAKKCNSCSIVFSPTIGPRCPCCSKPLATRGVPNKKNRQKINDSHIRY